MPRVPVPVLAALATSGLLLAGPPAAGAANTTIVINKSLGGVPFYAPASAVRARFGKPASVFKRQVPASGTLGAIRYETWSYPKSKLTVTLFAVTPSTALKVQSFETASRTFRTKNGLRVGTSAVQAQAKLTGEVCKPAGAPDTVCRIDGGRTGPTKSREYTTLVTIAKGAVSRIFMSHLPSWNQPPPS